MYTLLFSYNLHRYVQCSGLLKEEEDCLRHYIDNYTADHNTINCLMLKMNGRCLLCDSKIGIKPSIFKEDVKEDLPIDVEDVFANDVIWIDRNNENETDVIIL